MADPKPPLDFVFHSDREERPAEAELLIAAYRHCDVRRLMGDADGKGMTLTTVLRMNTGQHAVGGLGKRPAYHYEEINTAADRSAFSEGVRMTNPDKKLHHAFVLLIGQDPEKWPTEAKILVSLHALHSDIRCLKEVGRSLDMHGKGMPATVSLSLHAAGGLGKMLVGITVDASHCSTMRGTGFTPMEHVLRHQCTCYVIDRGDR